jgi:hypothetical protein
MNCVQLTGRLTQDPQLITPSRCAARPARCSAEVQLGRGLRLAAYNPPQRAQTRPVPERTGLAMVRREQRLAPRKQPTTNPLVRPGSPPNEQKSPKTSG